MPLHAILQHLRREPTRTWSVVITVFGDVVAPRGGSIWLGSLLAIFEAMEVGGGAVRTAMSRLTSEAWLERTRDGRHSHYAFGDRGRQHFAEAAARIYGPQAENWDGAFRLLLAEDDAARAAAGPPGFAAAAPGVWVAPGTAAFGRPDGFMELAAHADAPTARRLAGRLWPLGDLDEAYQRFVAAFAPVARASREGSPMTDLDALVARILLIHEYRRIVLRDPLLPSALLPPDWAGAAARALCREVYRGVLPQSERWLGAEGRGADGALPPADASLGRRFTTCYENTGMPQKSVTR